jgi:Uma2 family endonuclease
MTLIASQPSPAPQPHKFTREEYYQMGEMGIFRNQRVELIEGEIIDMAPQKDIHAVAIMLVQEAIRKGLPDYLVRCQLPLTLNDKTEPELDISVVPGKPRDYLGLGRHPSTAILVVEVSDSTLRFDRTEKASLYARAGVADYWIINLVENCVEVMRDPEENASGMYGYKYRTVATVRASEAISPLTKPEVRISVAELLP